MDALRILLVDDHALFRQGLKSLLEARPNIEVVGTAGDGLEAIALARTTVPHVILMDIEMPRCDGLEATRQIKREFPHIKIVVLTVVDDEDTIFEAIKCARRVICSKTLEANQLYDMLDGLQRGDRAAFRCDRGQDPQGVQTSGTCSRPKPQLVEELSERESPGSGTDVMGKTNKEIADALRHYGVTASRLTWQISWQSFSPEPYSGCRSTLSARDWFIHLPGFSKKRALMLHRSPGGGISGGYSPR